MRCSYCQRKVSSKDSVCPYCGAKIVAENEINQFNQDNEFNKNTEENFESKRQPFYNNKKDNQSKNNYSLSFKFKITILLLIIDFIFPLLEHIDLPHYFTFIILAIINIILVIAFSIYIKDYIEDLKIHSREYNPDADLLTILSFVLLFIGLLPIILFLFGKYNPLIGFSTIPLLFGITILAYLRSKYPYHIGSLILSIIFVLIFTCILLRILYGIYSCCNNCNIPG